ncbi:MAG: ABC transporter ATP-binding protein [Gelidibacter sp.]
MEPIIKVENLSKQYRLGTIGTGTLSHDITRWWYNIRGKDDPYLKIGQINDRESKGESEYVWALKDINFDVKPGEILGIIGKNGAGKSTLLKLLSRVTAPTTGKITCHGRIASLLEVGTGFHPELTGRENIFLNGAILGMTKKEIASKFDEIVEFAGCQKYTETPVKRYSSGMYVRLAFAVAAHLEPDILVVDEVLAVGDAEFQQKAIGKMQDVSANEGRTVLFVSHNMNSILDLCHTGLLMYQGGIAIQSDIQTVVDTYVQKVGSSLKSSYQSKTDTKENYIKSVRLLGGSGAEQSVLMIGESFTFDIHLKIRHGIERPNISIRLSNINEVAVACWRSNEINDLTLEPFETDTVVQVKIDNFQLLDGIYAVNMSLLDGRNTLDTVSEDLVFEVQNINSNYLNVSYRNLKHKPVVYTPSQWKVMKVSNNSI